jgi:hypothetical protein
MISLQSRKKSEFRKPVMLDFVAQNRRCHKEERVSYLHRDCESG